MAAGFNAAQDKFAPLFNVMAHYFAAFRAGAARGNPAPEPSQIQCGILNNAIFYRHFHQFQNGVLVRGFGQQAFETKLKGFRHCAAKRAAIRKCAKACCSRFLPPLLPPVPECSSQATFHAYFRILSGRAMNLPGFMARRIKYEGIAPPCHLTRIVM